jgi:hypothetical protein
MEPERASAPPCLCSKQVCCTVLDLLLLFTGGGGMMQRLNDHLLGSTLIMARMEGAGDNDSWQVRIFETFILGVLTMAR